MLIFPCGHVGWWAASPRSLPTLTVPLDFSHAMLLGCLHFPQVVSSGVCPAPHSMQQSYQLMFTSSQQHTRLWMITGENWRQCHAAAVTASCMGQGSDPSMWQPYQPMLPGAAAEGTQLQAQGSGFYYWHITASPAPAQRGCWPPVWSGVHTGRVCSPIALAGATQCWTQMWLHQHTQIMSSAAGWLHKNEPLAMPVPCVKGWFHLDMMATVERSMSPIPASPRRPVHPGTRWGCAVTVWAAPEPPGIVFSFLISFFKMTTL